MKVAFRVVNVSIVSTCSLDSAGRIRAKFGASTSQSNTIDLISRSFLVKFANDAVSEVLPTPPLPEIIPTLFF